ncbi:carboxypeptidase regulatory-like domain-containing protein [Chryseobacterium sp. 3008163]|uniref:carboxypeptidase regulatory-like domain-containing protein n=1 Tax=Chryseobacterium sp. 3008163 TaxID=2478663 RepID=UPI001E468D9E|nr:carboxypeptidase regulatory-like domain-containing protein [Chryseobacterium sp. 3008163]
MKSYFFKIFFLILIFFVLSNLFSQQKISGKIISENDMVITQVLVVNISNDKKTYSDAAGNFEIEACLNDEIRFSKAGYERAAKRIFDYNSSLNVVLIRIPEEIKEVEILNLTGDLNKDSKRLAKEDKVAKLQENIGLPKPPEKPREVPAELKKVLIAAAFGSVNVQAVYDLISGKARKQKRWYKYEDVQDKISWIRKRIDDEYFVDSEIPAERISEFLEFSFIIKPDVESAVKNKNLSRAMLGIETVIPIYVERLKNSTTNQLKSSTK